MVTKSDITEGIFAISTIIISVIVFEIVVQPILVFIHPMFIDHVVSVPARGDSKSPAELAWLATLVITFVLAIKVWPVVEALIKAYLPYNS